MQRFQDAMLRRLQHRSSQQQHRGSQQLIVLPEVIPPGTYQIVVSSSHG